MCLKAVCLLLMMSLCDRGDILRLYVMIIVFIFLTSCIIKHFWICTFLKGHLCRYTLGLRTNINMNYALNLYEQHTCFFFFCGHFPLSPDQHNFLQKISPDLLSVLRSNVSLIYYYHISLFPLRSCVRNCNFKIRSTITVTIISNAASLNCHNAICFLS